MTSVEEMVRGDQTMQDLIAHRLSNARLMAEEGPLVFCNLPARPSVSEWEPSRMSYYNGNERFAVPFKWELAPGKAIDPSESPEHQAPLQLRPPPSASNSPVHHQPASSKDQQKSHLGPKFRNYNPADFGIAVSSSNRSNGSTTTADSSSTGTGGLYRVNRDKDSISRRSEFDWPEVSDDESSTTRTTDDQEYGSTTTTVRGGRAKTGSFSFSFSSFSSNSSQSPPSPMDSRVGGSRVGSGADSAKDLYQRRNGMSFAVPSARSTASCYLSARGSTEGSEDGDEMESEYDDHVRPIGGFLSCMPLFSKGLRIVQSQFRAPLRFGSSNGKLPSVINCSARLTPGIRNRGYRQSL